MVDIDTVLSRMTLDEKLAQLGCVWCTALVVDNSFSPARAERDVPRLHKHSAEAALREVMHERGPSDPAPDDDDVRPLRQRTGIALRRRLPENPVHEVNSRVRITFTGKWRAMTSW